jgi:uncharacterized membrane protein YbhN (UPF0104 family)
MASGWQRWRWLAPWAGTAVAIACMRGMIDPYRVRAAFERIPAAWLVAACVLVALNVVVAAVRWQFALRAYGADRVPPLTTRVRLYFIAFFYNNYLPGAVAGDVVRGAVAHEVFAGRGPTAGLAVVLVERALGLFALFLLLGLGLVINGGVVHTHHYAIWTGIGLAFSTGLVLAVPVARRLAPFLPGQVGEYAARVPALSSWGAFAAAGVLSLLTQTLITLAGWVLLRSLVPVTFGQALLIIPLAAATTFIPMTVGGAGARELVYVGLGRMMLHLSAEDALAASLALWLAHLAVGGIGGVIQLVRRRQP